MEEFLKSIREQRLAQKVHIANQIDFTSEVPEELKKAVENTIQKGKSFPIGTIHNGYKKVGEGKWQRVSEHGLTKKEHNSKANFLKYSGSGFKHREASSKLSDKEYSDEEVVGGGDRESGLKVKDIVSYTKTKSGGVKIPFKGEVVSIDKDGKYAEVRNSIGDIDYISVKDLKAVDEDIEKSLNNISKYTDIDDIEKSIGHKYFKREGTQGNYKYYYTEEDYKAGRSSSGDKSKSEDDFKDILNQSNSPSQFWNKMPKETKKKFLEETGLMDQHAHSYTSIGRREGRPNVGVAILNVSTGTGEGNGLKWGDLEKYFQNSIKRYFEKQKS